MIIKFQENYMPYYREEVACFLVRAGCDLNSPRRPGSNGQGGEEAHDMATPLHLCCMFGLQQVKT